MGESPRGYHESNPPSRDLMARFDMAHDRKDRLPEVREYLENLRPQILKLQRELRLQTDEDIAGLERRGDIDMNEVDKLVGLIKAFKKAWNENAVSPSELARIGRERLAREVGDVWKLFSEIVSSVESHDRKLDLQAKQSAIMAIAHAGEPKLAWNLCLASQRGYMPVEILTEGDFLARLEIWKAFKAAGRVPPFDQEILVKALSGRVFFSDRIVERFIDALAQHGFPNDALGNVHKIMSPRRAVEALIRMRPYVKDPSRVDRRALTHSGPDRTLKILSHFVADDAGMAMAYAWKDGRWLGDASDTKEAVATGKAMIGDAKGALAVESFRRPTPRKMRTLGRVLAVILERGNDVPLAKEMAERLIHRLHEMRPDDLSRMTVGFLNHGETELAQRLSRRLIAPQPESFEQSEDDREQFNWDQARAILPVIRAFVDKDLDIDHLMASLEEREQRVAQAGKGPRRYAHLLVEAQTEAALRTFKRAAGRYRPRGWSQGDKWDRESWEEDMKEVLASTADIAEQLTYDKPLPA